MGYEMAEKNAKTHTQTHTHFRIYISRDETILKRYRKQRYVESFHHKVNLFIKHIQY